MKNTTVKRGGALALAITISAFCFLLSAFPASAQSPTFDSVTVSVPSTLAAGVTTNLATPLFVDCSKQNVQAFELSSTWSTAGEPTGQTNLTYTLCPSVSGVRFDTNHSVSLVAANWSAIGVTNTTVTNLTANGIRGWYITKIVNSSAGGIATNQFRYSTKISAP
jgi:hypothetical protein